MTVPLTTLWKNGTTQTTDLGSPPAGWVLSVDGFWYPPSVNTVTPTPVNTNNPATQQLIPGTKIITAFITVDPAIPTFDADTTVAPVTLNIHPIPLPLQDALAQSVHQLIGDKIQNFFDIDRELKTLLNFGNDYQALITNWEYDSSDPTFATILVKLYNPLPTTITVGRPLWIARELTPTVIDRVFIYAANVSPDNLYLRPPNRNVKVSGLNGKVVNNVTMRSLFSSSSFDLVQPTDPVLEQWYTHDVNSVELNIDYADYRNFVFYGAALGRLTAFKNKLEIIENIDSVITMNSSSLSTSGSVYITASLPYPAIYALAEQRIDMIRSFDGYERFLYYGTSQSYSSSLETNDYQDEMFFMADATWPKVNGKVVSIASASAWFEEISYIASSYDQINPNYLVNNIPQYVINDGASPDFLTFLDMIGHHFDNIKVYIDQMSNIYDRGNNPDVGISPDIIWNVAQSFGIDLPNQYAINKLVDYTIGEVNQVNPKVYRRIAAETWKRLVHNQIFLTKAKGTRYGLQGLVNAYGILPTTIQIRESATPSFAYPSSSFEIFEEQTNALSIPSGAFVQIPWSASTLANNSLEVRFSTINTVENVLIGTTGNKWSMTVKPRSGSYASVVLKNGTTPVLSSSFFKIYDGNFYSAMATYNPSGVSLYVKNSINGEIIDSYVGTEVSNSLASVWYTPANIFLGGSGSTIAQPFSGLVDEVRTWGEVISENIFNLHVLYPGLYNGNLETSARDELFVRLSFNISRNLGVTGSLPNESPFIRNTNIPILNTLTATGFPNIPTYPNNMEVVTRQVLRYSPNGGGSQYTSNKTVVFPTPSIRTITVDDSSVQVPVLSRTQSIVNLNQKRERVKGNNVIGFYFSITDAINDSITRSIGNINLQDVLGDPADDYNINYSLLNELDNLYWDDYAYTFNVNTFINFVDNLLDPLFTQARQMVPVRARLIAGIVHEPHMLERSKVQHKPIVVSAGKYTRDQSNPSNISGHAIKPNQDTISGATCNLSTTLSAQELLDVNAEDTDNDGIITFSDFTEIDSELTDKPGDINVSDTYTFASKYNAFDDFTNKVNQKLNLLQHYGVTSEIQLSPTLRNELNRQLQTAGNSNAISIIQDYMTPSTDTLNASGLIKIPSTSSYGPYNDFKFVDSYTYFSNVNGLVGVVAYNTVRVNQSVLTSKGNWAAFTTYTRNDYVSQSAQTGDATPGNGSEYVCISPDGTFTSTIAPFLDTRNWSPMKYTTVEYNKVVQAIIIGNIISLAPTGSGRPFVTGYTTRHFKFFRDHRLGTKRHQWLGCKQTDNTTIDGKPAVQVIPSSDSILIVQNGTPVGNQKTTGPILNVE